MLLGGELSSTRKPIAALQKRVMELGQGQSVGAELVKCGNSGNILKVGSKGFAD